MAKLIPHTMNALTTGLTDKPGDSEYLAMSQKGATELAAGGDGGSAAAGIEDAPSDGKFYARKDGAWVAIEATPAE